MTAADDEPARRLRTPGAVAHRRLAPRGLRRHARRALAFAAAVGVVARGHRDAPDLGPLAQVPGTPGLAEALVLVIDVRDLPDRRHALDRYPAHLARGHPHLRQVALLGQELGRRAGGPDDLAALAGDQLDVVDRGAERDVRDRQRVPQPGLGLGAGDDDVADLEPVGEEHVALLTVPVVEQADPGRPVGVVLDGREAGRHAGLVALEVDPPVVGLLAAAAVAHGEPARVVAARAALHRLEERLVRLVGGDLLERRAGHPPATRGGRLVASERHCYTPSKNSIFWPGASVTTALRHEDVWPTT